MPFAGVHSFLQRHIHLMLKFFSVILEIRCIQEFLHVSSLRKNSCSDHLYSQKYSGLVNTGDSIDGFFAIPLHRRCLIFFDFGCGLLRQYTVFDNLFSFQCWKMDSHTSFSLAVGRLLSQMALPLPFRTVYILLT